MTSVSGLQSGSQELPTSFVSLGEYRRSITGPYNTSMEGVLGLSHRVLE